MQNSLRPNNLDEFIGQEKIKQTLKVLIESAKKQRKQVDHILLLGSPGMGKTSLASVIANEMNSKIKFAQGPLLEKKADILSLFASLSKGDVLFVDEIHGINKNIEELIYSALEDGVIDIVLGPEGDSKVVRMKLPPFTFIGATTKSNKLSTPLKDRFGLIAKLVDYNESEIETIIKTSSKKLEIKIIDKAISIVASYSRGNPRVANNLLKRAMDFAIVENAKEVTESLVLTSFEKMGLYKWGLNDLHIDFMKVLSDTFYEKWASLDSISGIMLEDKYNLEFEVEPLLLKYGLIEKSSRGRRITNKGLEYITTYNLL